MSLYSAHYGNAAGTPLVLLHGWGMPDSGVWQPLLERLSELLPDKVPRENDA